MTGKGEDYTTGSLLDYDYYKKNYKLTACDLSKQKVLGSNPKASQQIEFVYKLDITIVDDNDNTTRLLDCVEMLVSKSVEDGIIDHNEFLAIMKEKKDYDCQKNEEKVETV